MKDNGIFIIESLNIKDEDNERYEGEILKRFLKLMGVRVNYVYVRTKRELAYFLRIFEESDFKYLHLSCHGNENGIGMTLNEIVSFDEINNIFKYSHKKRRLFLSSCEVMNGDIGDCLEPIKFMSIVGPTEKIAFSDAAIFWASFYHLILNEKKNGMDTKEIINVAYDLGNLYNVSIRVLSYNSEKECYIERKKVTKVTS